MEKFYSLPEVHSLLYQEAEMPAILQSCFMRAGLSQLLTYSKCWVNLGFPSIVLPPFKSYSNVILGMHEYLNMRAKCIAVFQEGTGKLGFSSWFNQLAGTRIPFETSRQ